MTMGEDGSSLEAMFCLGGGKVEKKKEDLSKKVELTKQELNLLPNFGLLESQRQQDGDRKETPRVPFQKETPEETPFASITPILPIFPKAPIAPMVPITKMVSIAPLVPITPVVPKVVYSAPKSSIDFMRPVSFNRHSLKPTAMSKIRKSKIGKSRNQRTSTKLLQMRFIRRTTADARILNKVQRLKRFWNRTSEVVPFVFKIVSVGENGYEFLDFSRKEILPDEPLEIKRQSFKF